MDELTTPIIPEYKPGLSPFTVEEHWNFWSNMNSTLMHIALQMWDKKCECKCKCGN